ncbi:NAD(P)H-hydrate epimerase [Candidatus Omnitrophota bacterium]
MSTLNSLKRNKKVKIKTVSAKRMQQIDRIAVARFGIPAVVLMENAGRVSAVCALKMLRAGQTKVVIFCGPGNNGGDGFVCARHLINWGLKVKVFFFGRSRKMPNAAKINYQILRKQGLNVVANNAAALKSTLKKCDLVVDAIFGIGLKSNLRQPYAEVISSINAAAKPTLSLDVPSGIDATSGRVCGVAIKAKHTVTFSLVKKGLTCSPAKAYVGKLTVADIGLPAQLIAG